MAAHYYGINRGDAMYQAVVSSSTTGKEIEVVVNTNVPDRQAVRTAIEKLEDFILQNKYPPL